MSAVIEDLSEAECRLFALLTDNSGLDLAEFSWFEPDNTEDGCWRAWPFQWSWFRCPSPLQIDQMARSVGKTLSITLRMFAFPFLFPGQEAVVTAPELVHLEPLTNLIERKVNDCRLGREMLPRGRSAVTHRPFMMNFVNGSRIIGRIPQRDGKGVKGCSVAGTLVLTDKGYVNIEELRVGDMVLTHLGRWRPVTAIHEDVNDCYEVTGQSSFPMTVSCDHRFYGAENLATPKQKRDFTGLGFHDVEFLTEHQVYWATPTRFPRLPVPKMDFVGTATIINQTVEDFWWLVGRYLADGFITQNGNDPTAKVHWICPDEKAVTLIETARTLGLHIGRTEREHSSADSLSLSSRAMGRWLSEHFGRLAAGKKLPAFALGLERPQRQALLDGYLAGDGWFDSQKKRWEVGSASKILVTGIQMLAQSLGYTVNCTVVQPKVTEIMGSVLNVEPQKSWRVQIGFGHPVLISDHLVAKVKKVVAVGKQTVYNPVIEEDHSYVTGSIVSHNIHPIWLEQDEGQDYPAEGWTELIETLKRGHEGAVWRVHGVTRGIRDKFYEFTQPSPTNPWRVHRATAMHRPNWTAQEREEKIRQYGSRDHPDYRRNVLGLHGDATNPLFVLHRLMKVVDDDLSSDYNTDEYCHLSINHEMLTDRGVNRDVVEFLDFPERHRSYTNTWAGMDVGYTNHPSEILIFGEMPLKDKVTKLKLITRIHLERISNPQQVRAICWVMDFYKPHAFAMDKTGVGLPLFQDLQDTSPAVAAAIRGYNFSEKILVDFDDQAVAEMKEGEDDVKEAGINRNVLEYSTDKLRELVDHVRFFLPWDTGLIGEFQGQTWSYSKEAMDMYGRRRRVYSQGSFHALDAARMAVLGYVQHTIEEMMRMRKIDDTRPVLDYFVTLD